MKKKKKSLRGMFIVLAFMIVLALLLFYPLPEETDTAQEEPEEITLTVRCAGDVMGHLSQLIANYDSSRGVYDFSGDYAYIKSYIEEADLALCNVETTFLGDGNYTGYPYFNSPDALAFDLAEAGFDVALFSNNHMLDTKTDGLFRSLDVLQSAGMQTAGAAQKNEAKTCIVSVEGVQIGIAAYTYETGLYLGKRTLNGSLMPEGAHEYISSFRYYALDEDLASISSDIANLKQNGADVVMTYFHWGEEYQRHASDVQRTIAKAAVDAGADIIFASHPHVLQEIEEMQKQYQVVPPVVEPHENEESWVKKLRLSLGLIEEEVLVVPLPETKTRAVPVFYSMGNLISNQREETLDNRYTEQGMIASVSFTYVPLTGEMKDVKTEYIPTWVDKYRKDGQTEYAIVPLVGRVQEHVVLNESGHVERALQALSDMNELIDARYVYQVDSGAE